jgi:hypothetical protein
VTDEPEDKKKCERVECDIPMSLRDVVVTCPHGVLGCSSEAGCWKCEPEKWVCV